MSKTATPVVSAANVKNCLTLYMSPPFAWHALSISRIASLRRNLHLHRALADVGADRDQKRRQRGEDLRKRFDVVAVRCGDEDRLVRKRRGNPGDDAGNRPPAAPPVPPERGPRAPGARAGGAGGARGGSPARPF